ncbi:MAG: hypothetical protein P1Q69_03420 [Candidatus Thorarchaeota archaeon]|nr:hypothetical protein [Candidatus Thorarchaeota archaeon]
MSDQETRLEDMCSHYRRKPARRRYSGAAYKYCSLECMTAENYRFHIPGACCFGIIFPIAIFALLLALTGTYPYFLNPWDWIQLMVFILGFFYFGYIVVVGYRAARRERNMTTKSDLEHE